MIFAIFIISPILSLTSFFPLSLLLPPFLTWCLDFTLLFLNLRDITISISSYRHNTLPKLLFIFPLVRSCFLHICSRVPCFYAMLIIPDFSLFYLPFPRVHAFVHTCHACPACILLQHASRLSVILSLPGLPYLTHAFFTLLPGLLYLTHAFFTLNFVPCTLVPCPIALLTDCHTLFMLCGVQLSLPCFVYLTCFILVFYVDSRYQNIPPLRLFSTTEIKISPPQRTFFTVIHAGRASGHSFCSSLTLFTVYYLFLCFKILNNV